jgi:hypothetical protein
MKSQKSSAVNLLDNYINCDSKGGSGEQYLKSPERTKVLLT